MRSNIRSYHSVHCHRSGSFQGLGFRVSGLGTVIEADHRLEQVGLEAFGGLIVELQADHEQVDGQRRDDARLS